VSIHVHIVFIAMLSIDVAADCNEYYRSILETLRLAWRVEVALWRR
jgi:hypothetical protein